MTLPDIYVPAGSSGHGSFTVDIDPQRAGWAFSGLRVLGLEAGAS
ncbi:MAG: 5-deoxy-glucuronate isomerase, partial [Thermobifida sp.]|nr:5-deoxy-glucuronate isomerase [Thermobifida sp.]